EPYLERHFVINSAQEPVAEMGVAIDEARHDDMALERAARDLRSHFAQFGHGANTMDAPSLHPDIATGEGPTLVIHGDDHGIRQDHFRALGGEPLPARPCSPGS